MKPKPEACSIVLAGFWNRMIFTPEWVSPRLFPDPEIETVVALLPVMPLIYRNREVGMEVSSARLVFRPRVFSSDSGLQLAEEMALRVLEALPETPVQAVGINFGYSEKYPSDRLVGMFNHSDDAELAQVGWTIAERKLIRQLNFESSMLNLALTFNGQAVDFDLNFHTETPSHPTAVGALTAGRAVTLREAGLSLLRDVYRVELEEEYGDD